DYPIIARYGGRAGFDHEVGCFFIPPNLAPEEIKSTCIQIYKMLAKDYIPKRAMEIAKDMGLTPSSIKITSAHKRLGSCNNRGSINLSWRLIQLPDDLIDYIAAHEAAHLKYLDHSNLFWGVVAEYMPDHKKRRARLKELQRRLYAEGW
ncbi:MAG: M48 family metallopeptidase, partial [Defluviitaleaceae bacterium]|nr:M48 family metallopeptidase [Defluviitaleaceae bacterium]